MTVPINVLGSLIKIVSGSPLEEETNYDKF